MQKMNENLINIEGLVLRFYTYEGVVQALDGIDLQIKPGEILGVVGETGCGKSVTSLSIIGIVPSPGYIEGGKIFFNEEGKEVNLLKQKEDYMRSVRGSDISMVFQEPRAYLNPVYTVEDQVGEVLVEHRKKEFIGRAAESMKEEHQQKIEESKKKEEEKVQKTIVMHQEKIKELKKKGEKENREEIEALTSQINELKKKPVKVHVSPPYRMKLYERWYKKPNGLSIRPLFGIPIAGRILRRPFKKEIRNEVVSLLKSLGIADPERVVDMYPHELSGGMAQRVVIAMALACNPKLLICDEPTTNLDVTVQAQILELIRTLRENFKSAILYITHDLGVIAELCERVAVMYAGNVVEVAEIFELFQKPLHPYTSALLASIPRPGCAFRSIPGIVPSLISPPTGCRFHERCLYAMDTCMKNKPPLIQADKGHMVACHLYRGQ